MQGELDADYPGLGVHLLGVNEVGYESGIATMSAGRTLPLLQDLADVGLWASWAVTWRDVIILDGRNEKLTVYNLTEHNLEDTENYSALKDLLIGYALAE